MKKFLSLVLAVVMVLSVCSIASAEDPITVTFWHTRGSGANLECVENSVADFNATIGAEKGIVVEQIYIGNYADEFAKLQLAFQAGELPTVATAGNTYVGILMNDGVITDMAPYAKETGFDTSNILDCFMQIYGNTDGQLYSLPYVRSTPVFYYNKTMADAAGCTEAPKTWEELETFCKTIMAKNEGVAGYELLKDFGYMGANWIYQSGSEFIAGDTEKASAPCLEDGTMVDVLTKWSQAIKDGWCVPYATTSADSSMKESFYMGKLVCFTGSCASMKNVLAKAAENNIEVGVSSFISWNKDTDLVVECGGGQLVLLANNSEEETKAGWEYLQYCMSDAAVAASSIGSGYIPVTKSCGESKTMTDFWAVNPTYKVAYDQMGYARCQELPYVLVLQDYIDAIHQNIDAMIQEQTATAEETVKAIADECKSQGMWD